MALMEFKNWCSSSGSHWLFAVRLAYAQFTALKLSSNNQLHMFFRSSVYVQRQFIVHVLNLFANSDQFSNGWMEHTSQTCQTCGKGLFVKKYGHDTFYVITLDRIVEMCSADLRLYMNDGVYGPFQLLPF
ncbi:hypothetical protein niasHS_016538 [Heterodera schachtii]|uniref:CULT domain-containing protein n=1 Tax=Heterodera schachtii TaxID=97005 RepID=A0ABD2HNK7_HETSC